MTSGQQYTCGCHARMVRVPLGDTEVVERHLFPDLSTSIATTSCQRDTFTEQLEPDDASLSMCPTCQLFHAAMPAHEPTRGAAE
jgi:hypothetical protein